MTESGGAESYIDFLEREFSSPPPGPSDVPVREPAVETVSNLRGRRVEERVDWSDLSSAVAPRSVIGPLFGVTRRDIDRACRRLATDPDAVVPRQHAAKRLQDACAAAFLILVLLPAFLAIIIAIRLESRGPTIFRQQRIGAGGRPFGLYKFRTLKIDAEAVTPTLADGAGMDGVLFKLRIDGRVTAVGRFLRRYSLDELPELFNVLRGDMSFVGPRAALPSEAAHYDQVTRRRLLEKPGITGLWQVTGHSDLSWQDTVALDLDYVDHRTMLRDFGILLRTLKIALRGSPE